MFPVLPYQLGIATPPSSGLPLHCARVGTYSPSPAAAHEAAVAYASYPVVPNPTSCVFAQLPGAGVVVVPVASTKHRLGSADAAHAAAAAAWSAPWSVHVAEAMGQIVSDRRRRVPAVMSWSRTRHCAPVVAVSLEQKSSASVRLTKPVHCW
jgi:hypothetical protein